MRPLLAALAFITNRTTVGPLEKMRLGRSLCRLAEKVAFTGDADRLLAKRLAELIFRHDSESVFLYPGYFDLFVATINVSKSNFILDRNRVEPPTYEELLAYSLRVANLPLKQRLELIEALNRWMYFIYANWKGLMFIPHSAWHIFDTIKIFRQSVGVPFEAYCSIVEEAVRLADRALIDKVEKYDEVPGFDNYISNLNKLEYELTPLYPSLQDYHQGGH